MFRQFKLFLNYFPYIIILISIMGFSKLCPIIPCSWSDDFCNTWNDLLFGISCSILCGLIASCIMYYHTDLKPRKEFSDNVKPILKQKLTFIHQAFDYIFQQFGGHGEFPEKNDEELVKIMISKNLADKMDNDSNLLYKDIVLQTLIEVRQITTEILSYHNFLNNEQITELGSIVNMTYPVVITAKKCNADSEVIQRTIITGQILQYLYQLYERDIFMKDMFVPSYRVVLKLENSFKLDNLK